MSNCNDNWKGCDKILHFSICFVLAVISPILAICIAVLKEWYDAEIECNHFCWKDILADAIGIVVGSAIHIQIIEYIFCRNICVN